jgi:hypothetical protein
MAEIPRTAVKQLVGKVVRLALADGSAIAADLLSFDGRSLWLVVAGEDRFVALREIRSMMAEGAAVPA